MDAVLKSMNLGGMIGQYSYATYSPLTDGMIRPAILTELITAKDTNRETCDLQQDLRTPVIKEVSGKCKKKLMTYDIAYAGPRNRFMIATDAGPLIVHNCGYGMGATKFQTQLKNFGVDTPLEECKRIIDVYRKTYPKIPELWRDAHDALTDMMDNKASDLGRNGLLKIEGKNGIRLPNDLYIKYPNIRKVQQEDGKSELLYDTKKGRSFIPTRIYGGKMVENLCQALARIVIGGQMLMIAKKYRVVTTVHDAVACIVPEGEAELAKEYVELCMRLRPEWAQDLPLNCESGYGHSYGEC